MAIDERIEWEDLDPNFKLGRRYRVVQVQSPFYAVMGLEVIVVVEPKPDDEMVIVRVGDHGRVIRLPRSWLQPLVDRAWLEKRTPADQAAAASGDVPTAGQEAPLPLLLTEEERRWLQTLFDLAQETAVKRRKREEPGDEIAD